MMPKFHVVQGGPEPVTPEARSRKRTREAKVKQLPQCDVCGGRETIDARIGSVKNKICVACLVGGRRVVVG